MTERLGRVVMSLGPIIYRLRERENLSVDETREAFDSIFAGQVSEEAIAALLLALHRKGETADEILGAVLSMRAKALTINAPKDAIDVVGTGGDAKGTFNISTAVALVVAACGVPVAKHGNRAATSQSGSSDVLAALGINLEPSVEILEECLMETCLCFLFAPRHHPAMRFVAPVRKKLGVRTIFNLLGPLTNPGGARHQLMGVFAPELTDRLAAVLRDLGSQRVWVVHAADGLDELSTLGPTRVSELKDGHISTWQLDPSTLGIEYARLSDLQVAGVDDAAAALVEVLDGKLGPRRDIVLLNAAAALVVAEKAGDLREGLTMAGAALDSGKARAAMEMLARLTQAA